MLGKSSARFFYFYQKDRLKYQLSRRQYGYSRKDFVLRNSASHHVVKEKIIIFIMMESYRLFILWSEFVMLLLKK